ncbi:hypothetical protein ACFJIV_29195 [Mucilaginibacter sp. UC70_90]
MENIESPVEKTLQEWKGREQLLKTLVSPSVLLKEKLAHYEMMQARFGGAKNYNDVAMLRSLRRERREIERKLFPNLAYRLIRRLVTHIDLKARSNKLNSEREQNKENIRQYLINAGLGAYANQAVAKMNRSQERFSLPVLLKTGEKERFDIDLQFKPDHKGVFIPQGFQATLKDEQGKSHRFFVEQDANLSTRQAYNLLSGRPVFSEHAGWMQLDLNDKDGAGNYRLRHFSSDHQIRIEAALRKLPVKIGADEFGGLVAGLKNGEKSAVTLHVNKKDHAVAIGINPLKNELLLYKANGERTTLYELGNPGKVMKLEPRINEEQKQTKDQKRSLKI